MEEQYTGDSEVDPEEWASWRAIRGAATEWLLRPRNDE